MRGLAPYMAALVAAALLGGCGFPVRSREVEQLQLIQTMGYDVRDGVVTVSVSSGKQLGGEPPVCLAARGETIPRAVENLQGWSAREELFFAHVRFALVGEVAAARGVGPLLDYFERGTQTSLELPLMVVRGGDARELVTASADPDYEVTALLTSLQKDAERMGLARCFTLRQIAQRLARSGAALCCAVYSRPAGENIPSAEKNASALLCAGYAVLKNGALAGYLDPQTALGADLVMDLAGQADYVLEDAGRAVTVSLRDCETSLAPLWDENGALTVAVTTHLRAGILSSDGPDPSDPETLQRLNESLSRAAARQEEAALAASRRLGADYMELLRSLKKKAPRAVAGTDAERFARSLRWRVTVYAEIERSYDIDGRAEEDGHG